MEKKNLNISGIPSILWENPSNLGNPADQLFIAVHGNMSSKDDAVIVILAEEATAKGYRVLSFDLPKHGERKDEDYACKVQNCVRDLTVIMSYAQTVSHNISLFACSLGAYFSLIAYRDSELRQCLLLSPILNMERLISNMMAWSNISIKRLETEKEIETPIGQTLYWDYYCYVKSHPINKWDKPTSILYGSDDNLSEIDVVSDFIERFDCKLQIMEHGEHYFHTEEQLDFYRQWLKHTVLI